MNDNYDFSDYRAVMPYTGDAGIFADDETARLEERDECYAAYGKPAQINFKRSAKRPA